MKKFTKSLFTLLLSLTLINCSSTSSISDSGKSKITGKNKTYAVNFSNNGDKEITTSDKSLIIKTFENKMEDKGYVKSEKPDIFVVLNLETIAKKPKSSYHKITNYENGKAQITNRSVYGQINVYEINEQTYDWNLNAEFINAAENKLISKVESSENIVDKSDRSFKEKSIIRDLVSRIIKLDTTS